MCVRLTIEVEHMRLLYKARGGWNVSCDLPHGQVKKYYSRIDCQNWANLARESSHLKISQQLQAIQDPYLTVHPSILERQRKCTHRA